MDLWSLSFPRFSLTQSDSNDRDFKMLNDFLKEEKLRIHYSIAPYMHPKVMPVNDDMEKPLLQLNLWPLWPLWIADE